MMKEETDTPEFWDHYNQLLKGRSPVAVKRNFEALILSYFESDAYEKLKPRTKSDYRKYIGHIRTIWGQKTHKRLKHTTSTSCTARMRRTGGKLITLCR